ncbi:MAG: hypothetical protein FJ398_01735 [Verrucomicrobia bacterium]|nr:hypothetical protein [Verrucomicrobiota bacterium]
MVGIIDFVLDGHEQVLRARWSCGRFGEENRPVLDGLLQRVPLGDGAEFAAGVARAQDVLHRDLELTMPLISLLCGQRLLRRGETEFDLCGPNLVRRSAAPGDGDKSRLFAGFVLQLPEFRGWNAPGWNGSAFAIAPDVHERVVFPQEIDKPIPGGEPSQDGEGIVHQRREPFVLGFLREKFLVILLPLPALLHLAFRQIVEMSDQCGGFLEERGGLSGQLMCDGLGGNRSVRPGGLSRGTQFKLERPKDAKGSRGYGAGDSLSQHMFLGRVRTSISRRAEQDPKQDSEIP